MAGSMCGSESTVRRPPAPRAPCAQRPSGALCLAASSAAVRGPMAAPLPSASASSSTPCAQPAASMCCASLPADAAPGGAAVRGEGGREEITLVASASTDSRCDSSAPDAWAPAAMPCTVIMAQVRSASRAARPWAGAGTGADVALSELSNLLCAASSEALASSDVGAMPSYEQVCVSSDAASGASSSPSTSAPVPMLMHVRVRTRCWDNPGACTRAMAWIEAFGTMTPAPGR
mmetsp:Transcript_20271/g.51314  ORF Transcript_20271/g.51314 Transcript_20271/m.51314 type:complete len:233 (+) Transcript_20271:3257-3955(+)